MKPTVRLGLIVDQFDAERALQIKFIVAGIGNTLNRQIEVVYESIDTFGLLSAPDIDLLIIDYGGVSEGSTIVEEWADLHPSSLVVFWTDHTSSIYKEVTKEFGELFNSCMRTVDDTKTWVIKAKEYLG